MLEYQKIMVDILMNAHTTFIFKKNGDLDLSSFEIMFKSECPGNFTLHWKHQNKKLQLFGIIDLDLIQIIFKNEYDQVEWLLKNS